MNESSGEMSRPTRKRLHPDDVLNTGKQTPESNIQDGEMDTNPVSSATMARFQGSFAVGARPPLPQTPRPWYSNRDYFLKGWASRDIWKAACIEGIATASLVYTSGQITATLMNYKTVQLGAYIGIGNIFLLSIFIYATAASSGGHINPLITFSAILSGICPLARGIYYMIAQTTGGALAGGILMGVWGKERAVLYQGGGCFFDPSEMSSGQVFLNETTLSFALLFLAYGVGLDPRQAILFGPRLGPLLVGVSVGLTSFASSGAIPGYAGAQMNPARCFAFGIARRNLSDQWIWWFGPAAAALLLAIVYNLIPPHFASARDDKEKDHVLPIMRDE